MPQTSFQAKRWLEALTRESQENFPRGVKVPKKSLFPKPFISWENSLRQEKRKAIFKGKLSFGAAIFPPRENLPDFPLEGSKILPQKMFRVVNLLSAQILVRKGPLGCPTWDGNTTLLRPRNTATPPHKNRGNSTTGRA